MRGRSSNQSSMLCLLSPEERVPKDHPLRPIRRLADDALALLSDDFNVLYAESFRRTANA